MQSFLGVVPLWLQRTLVTTHSDEFRRRFLASWGTMGTTTLGTALPS